MNPKYHCLLRFCMFFLIGIFLCSSQTTKQTKAAVLKLRYNDKIHINTSEKRKIKYKNQKISKDTYPAFVLEGAYVAPYEDIFKNGIKAKCSYDSANETLVIKKNDVVIEMILDDEIAYVNGKKTEMPVAAKMVRFMSRKKTKIVVPVAFVAEHLKLQYKKESDYIALEPPLKLRMDNQTIYYDGMQGKLSYNHSGYSLKKMPVVKINGTIYLPADEICDIIGISYLYDSNENIFSITNEDTGMHFSCMLNSSTASLNGAEVSLVAPAKWMINEAGEQFAIIPSDVLTNLGYEINWLAEEKLFKVQAGNFFAWKADLTEEQQANQEINYIYEMKSAFELKNETTGVIHLLITGSQNSLIKQASIEKNDETLTITLPKSVYLLEKGQFSNWKEIIDLMQTTPLEDGSFQFTLHVDEDSEYSYVFSENVLDLQITCFYQKSKAKILSNYSLNIWKPDGMTISSVTNEDLYEQKKFQIMLKGNYISFLKKNPVLINDSHVKKVSLSKKSGKTVITISTSSLQGYKIYESEQFFVVKMGTPRKIYSSIVVLDAGHGGHDFGASFHGAVEKRINLKIIYTYMKKYFSENAPEIKVYWTRKQDRFLTLNARAAFAKKVGADVFISLHMNSAPNRTAGGTEVYYSTVNNRKRFGGITSSKMAALFEHRILTELNMKNRKVRKAPYYVVKFNSVPAVLIELGFITNTSNRNKLKSSSFQKKAAKTIYKGITSLFSNYETGRF